MPARYKIIHSGKKLSDLSATTSAELAGVISDETGTDKLVFNTSPTFVTSITTPSVLATANDSGALGASGTAFSDLFLASGGVINWVAGNATLTHSTGLLTSNVPISLGTSNAFTCGSIELGAASDTTFTRISAGVVAIEGNNILTANTGLPVAGGTMTGKQVKAGTSEVAKTYTPSSGSQTVTIDCAVNNHHVVTGNASGTAITFAVSNATDYQVFTVSVLQGASTLTTIAAWFATVRWAGGTAPTLTATASKRDTFIFIRTGANTYDGFIVGQNC